MLIKSLTENICYLLCDGYRLITHLWLLKCCKIKNPYNMKIYFHKIKITFDSMKYIFITSLFFRDIKIYCYSIKKSLYPIK